MAVIRILPRAVGFYDTWTLGAGASKTAAVQADDGDTSYITKTAGDSRQTFLMDPVSSLLVSVSSVTHGHVSKESTSGSAPFMLAPVRQGGVDDEPNSGTLTTSYATYTTVRATKPGGGAWTPAIVDTTEAGVFGQTPDDSPVFRTTFIYLDVTGVPFAGGIAQLIASLGPFIALGLYEMPKLVRYLARTRRVLIEPHEVTQAWRELKELRHPRHFFMTRTTEVS